MFASVRASRKRSGAFLGENFIQDDDTPEHPPQMRRTSPRPGSSNGGDRGLYAHAKTIRVPLGQLDADRAYRQEDTGCGFQMSIPAHAPPQTMIIHIGRRKVGSTSIQHSLAANRERLADQGLLWPDSAQTQNCNFRDFLDILDAGDQESLDRISNLSGGNPDMRVVLSSEYLFGASLSGINMLMNHANRVIFYTRPYADWIQSVYMQHNKMARDDGNPDFDIFYSQQLKHISMRPGLSRWMEAIGPEKLHIRHTTHIPNSDVVADFFCALGVDRPPTVLPRENQAWHWLTVELSRALLKSDPQLSSRSFRKWLTRLDRVIRKRDDPLPKADYLSAEQRGELEDLYRDDSAWLLDRAGVEPPGLEKAGPGRRFLPSLDHAPQGFRLLVEQSRRPKDLAPRLDLALQRLDTLR